MKLARIFGLFGLWISFVSCEAPGRTSFENHRIIDLSYAFDGDTLYWPTEGRFDHERTAWGITAGGYWYSSCRFAGSEHGGTHLDAPIHFSEGKWAVADIPVDRLAGPGVVIDIAAQCESDPDYLLSVADIDEHEAEHGPIPIGAAVLVRTGWGSRWPDAKTYLGSDVPGDTLNLHFPGVSAEAAQALVDRGISMAGIDTASIDRGMSRNFRAHQILAEAQIVCLENVALSDEVPERGSTIIAMPMKIGAGSGAPCRIIALVER